MNYRNRKESIPLDWGFDEQGQPTANPEAVRSLNPIGKYKGYGLGMMVEILCSFLAGGPFALQLIPMFTSINEKRHISHFFITLDIRKFRSIESFQDDLEAMALQVRSLPTIEGAECVMIPGDQEKRTLLERTSRGIQVDDGVYTDFLSISKDFSEALRK
jgi:ureidoglycolate dehydrogenase (NAD+)